MKDLIRSCWLPILVVVSALACGDDSNDVSDPDATSTGNATTSTAGGSTLEPTSATDAAVSTDSPSTTGAETTTGAEESSGEGTTTGGTSGEETAATLPEAPSGLEVSEVEGGGHLVWSDNSDNEDEFVVMRSTDGGEFVEVWSVPFDTATFHDTPGPGSHTWYVYAVNAAGMSEPSNEATLVLP